MKIPTDKELLMRFVGDEPMNGIQINYLKIHGYLTDDLNLTEKGLELAYGESRKTDSPTLQD